jgi:hypothetical protein
MRILFLLCFAFLLSACRDQMVPNSLMGMPGPSNQGENPSSGCFVYEALRSGDCSSLVNRDMFSAAELSQYDYVRSPDARYKPPVRLMDLTKISLDTLVTPSFKLSEYLSASKGRYGFIAEHALLFVEKVRQILGVPVKITSGFRSPGYNSGIDGSASLSRHMYGDGIDLKTASATPTQIKAACQKVGASYIQLYADGHVHCDWRNHPLDGTFTDDDGVIGPTTAEISAMSNEDFEQMQKGMAGEPVITVVSGAFVYGDTIQLRADLEEQEDPGELYVEWDITLPSGKVITALPGNFLEIQLTERGEYRLSARVGGFAEANERFVIQ